MSRNLVNEYWKMVEQEEREEQERRDNEWAEIEADMEYGYDFPCDDWEREDDLRFYDEQERLERLYSQEAFDYYEDDYECESYDNYRAHVSSHDDKYVYLTYGPDVIRIPKIELEHIFHKE